ncbi:MAG: type II toxin-antitoxin system prevent-host-death family antitoxin [Chloroflexi bacterium]|nr:type II toxin-antitoxin system prevent-host-death family antitoxin [Chloroflexota bacterium]
MVTVGGAKVAPAARSRVVLRLVDRATPGEISIVVIKTVNISTLKDKLSGYLRRVQQGDIVLVSDRGTVVAEIRKPSLHGVAADLTQDRLEKLADMGVVRLGLPNTAAAYKKADVQLPAEVIDRALYDTRGE